MSIFEEYGAFNKMSNLFCKKKDMSKQAHTVETMLFHR